jgi:glutamate synthase (NADPH/NADH) small chain
MGFVQPTKGKLIRDLENMGMELDRRGNVKTNQPNGEPEYRSTLEKVYAAGDVRRGQSLVVWAISEGRKCAATVHNDLMKSVSRAYTMH